MLYAMGHNLEEAREWGAVSEETEDDEVLAGVLQGLQLTAPSR
jgi:hypothetical protein